MDETLRARRGLWIFFAVLVPLSAIFEGMIIRRVQLLGRGVSLFFLMWSPAVASFVARIVNREGFGDLSFRIGGPAGRRALGYAFAFPLAMGALAYGFAWATGLTPFDPPTYDFIVLDRGKVDLAGSPAIRLIQQLGLHLTAGTAMGLVWVAGEEIGWRGYLAPRLLDARVPRALVLSGLVWSMWHWPLELRAGGPFASHKILAPLLFTLVVIVLAMAMARLRLGSGSMWPPIVLHAVWNEYVSVLDSATSDQGLWLSESGVLTLIACLLLLWPLLRGKWGARRAPGMDPYARFGALS